MQATDRIGVYDRDAVYRRILDLLEAETDEKVYRDQEIAEILLSEGIQASRRTVNKYRAEMGIPTAGIRKAKKKVIIKSH